MTADLVVPVSRVRAAAGALPLPRYMTADAAGMDIYADLSGDLTLPPLGRALIPTGFALALPQGYEAQVRPRSGLSSRHGITMVNSPGTIDSNYRGEVMVPLINLGKAPFTVERGMRIAQMLVLPVPPVEIVEVDALDDTDRGAGGFGHTGS